MRNNTFPVTPRPFCLYTFYVQSRCLEQPVWRIRRIGSHLRFLHLNQQILQIQGKSFVTSNSSSPGLWLLKCYRKSVVRNGQKYFRYYGLRVKLENKLRLVARHKNAVFCHASPSGITLRTLEGRSTILVMGLYTFSS